MSELLNNSQDINQSQRLTEAQKSADKYEIIILLQFGDRRRTSVSADFRFSAKMPTHSRQKFSRLGFILLLYASNLDLCRCAFWEN